MSDIQKIGFFRGIYLTLWWYWYDSELRQSIREAPVVVWVLLVAVLLLAGLSIYQDVVNTRLLHELREVQETFCGMLPEGR